jgi:tryptophanyl-tRNA synthetase
MIRPALALTERYEAYYFIADLHALISVKNGEEMRQLSYEVAATWLALGLDPNRAVLYRQSDVPEVCELAWLLQCVTPKGLMNRAHAYKAMVDENRRHDRSPDVGVNMGLYAYPVLMTADILFPGAHVVPVGADQQQHLEIAVDIVETFNGIYGEVFVAPKGLIGDEVGTVPGLDGRKMSKSYGNVIPILAPARELRRTVMRIVTDSRSPEEPKEPEMNRIYQLFKLVAPDEAVQSMANRYRAGGLGYGRAKQELYEVLEAMFAEPRRRYDEVIVNRPYLDRVLANGAERVRAVGNPILQAARRAVGIGPGA